MDNTTTILAIIAWAVVAIVTTAAMCLCSAGVKSGRHIDDVDLTFAALFGMTWPGWLAIAVAFSPAWIGILVGLKLAKWRVEKKRGTTPHENS